MPVAATTATSRPPKLFLYAPPSIPRPHPHSTWRSGTRRSSRRRRRRRPLARARPGASAMQGAGRRQPGCRKGQEAGHGRRGASAGCRRGRRGALGRAEGQGPACARHQRDAHPARAWGLGPAAPLTGQSAQCSVRAACHGMRGQTPARWLRHVCMSHRWQFKGGHVRVRGEGALKDTGRALRVPVPPCRLQQFVLFSCSCVVQRHLCCTVAAVSYTMQRTAPCAHIMYLHVMCLHIMRSCTIRSVHGVCDAHGRTFAHAFQVLHDGKRALAVDAAGHNRKTRRRCSRWLLRGLGPPCTEGGPGVYHGPES